MTKVVYDQSGWFRVDPSDDLIGVDRDYVIATDTPQASVDQVVLDGEIFEGDNWEGTGDCTIVRTGDTFVAILEQREVNME